MKVSKRLIRGTRVVWIAALATTTIVGVAWAGTWATGYGPTRSAAIAAANEAAKEDAAARKTCYRRAKGEDCKQTDGEWMCRAEVTNHNRNNPGGVCAS